MNTMKTPVLFGAATMGIILALFGLYTALNPAPKMCIPSSTYTVQSGDTMWGIAAANNIDTGILREFNSDKSVDLVPKTLVVIPKCH